MYIVCVSMSGRTCCTRYQPFICDNLFDKEISMAAFLCVLQGTENVQGKTYSPLSMTGYKGTVIRRLRF